ncbi:MAG: 1,4-alpha-glucan branching protein GlgB [Acidimicrobiia bacterium]
MAPIAMADPHTLLGPHEVLAGSGRWQVRAWRPGATAITLVNANGPRVIMRPVKPDGLFVADVPSVTVPEYHFDVTFGDETFSIGDPYRFLPTLGEVDLHLIGEGRHRRLWTVLGSHVRAVDGVAGTAFAVWAPSARFVRVVGDFNAWDGRVHPMRLLGVSGVWELFVPGVGAGARYKYELIGAEGALKLRTDPMARRTEVPPATASIVCESSDEWDDEAWMRARAATDQVTRPLRAYEVHLGSWRPGLGYRDVAEPLADYVADLGFTHVELLPVAEHPFGGSWGYQVTGYYAPTARWGTPDDFRFLVDTLHRRGIGVIVDWVPAHFPKDEWALARFDGTALYEHLDPRLGEHPDWGTYVFNYGRNEVRNFLVANALYWLEEFHVDGLRVDAVASMLYLDYSRKAGEWIPNRYGGRENIEAIEFIREMNTVVHEHLQGVVTVAEESTSWPMVTRPVEHGGLGFTHKWNMGWMHDTLEYFAHDPVHRRWHHRNLTFGLLYAHSENFVLPLSHDEVVHGKGSLVRKMAGDRWQQLANLRSLYGWMWAYPGGKLLFMGGEIAQSDEWSDVNGVTWDLLQHDEHRGVQELVRAVNRAAQEWPAVWERDHEPGGFQWLDADDADRSVYSFLRWGGFGQSVVAVVANLTPLPREGYRIGLPWAGDWQVVLDTNASFFGGSAYGGVASVVATDTAWQSQPCSAVVTLPPLSVLWLGARRS